MDGELTRDAHGGDREAKNIIETTEVVMPRAIERSDSSRSPSRFFNAKSCY